MEVSGKASRRGRLRLVRTSFALVLVGGIASASYFESLWPCVWLLPSLIAGVVLEAWLGGRPHAMPLRFAALGIPALTLALLVPASPVSLPGDGLAPPVLAALAVEAILAASPLTPGVLAALAGTAIVHLLLLGVALPFATFLAPALLAAGLLVELALQFEMRAFPESLARGSGFSRRADRELKRRLEVDARGLRAGSRILGPLVSGMLACGVLLFVFVPRITLDALRAPDPTSAASDEASAQAVLRESTLRERPRGARGVPLGFEGDVFLANVGRLPDDETPVLRIRCRTEDGSPWEPGPYLRVRGMALDTYRNGTWFNTFPRVTRRDGDDGATDGWTEVAPARPAVARVVAEEIEIEPVGTRSLFGAGEPLRVELPAVDVDRHGCIAFPELPVESVRYRILGSILKSPDTWRIEPGAEEPPLPAHYFRLPEAFPEIERLARAVTGPAKSRFAACVAVERFLRTNYTYDLAFESTSRFDPVEEFLFVQRSGYCVHFASAMIVMLRSLGIPCRMACGFLTDERGEAPGTFVARQKDAHAWVEVHFRTAGWVAFDPSPQERDDPLAAGAPRWLRWLEWLAGFDESDRLAVLEGLRHGLLRFGLPGIALLAAAAMVLAVVRARRTARRGRPGSEVPDDPGLDFYRSFLTSLARHGLRRRRTATPHELAREASAILPADAIWTITDAFCGARYGGKPLSAPVRASVTTALCEIEAHLGDR